MAYAELANMSEPRQSTPVKVAPKKAAAGGEVTPPEKRMRAKQRFAAAQARALASESNLRVLRELAKR